MMSEIELQKVWLDLKKAIEEIQQRCTSKHMSYVDLYRYSYELVINQKGNQLYTNLKCVVSKHLVEIVRKRILEHQGSMLHIVIKEWAEHQVIMSMIRDILLYLDCVFVPENYLGDIFDVGVVIFKDKIIDHPDINKKFVRCILEMVASDRAGGVVDKTAVKNALQMLVNLGIGSLQCYEENFELQFLKDSFEFYRSVYSEFISKGDIMGYIEMAQKLIQDEKKRAEMYMIKDTQEKVCNLVEGELIQSHMTEIIEIGPNGIRKLILEGQIKSLKQLYVMFDAHQGGADLLLDFFIKILREQFEAIYQEDEQSRDGKTTSATVAVNIVRNLVELFDKYKQLALAVEDKNLELKFVTEFKSFLRQKSSISEYLSLYIASFMKMERGEKEVSEEDLEAKMDGAMYIFRCIGELDTFEAYYRRYLTHRLIENKSIGYDYERNMVSRFKEMCGWQSTNHIEQMFKDIQLSKDCNDEFKKQQNEEGYTSQKSRIDLNVTALWDIKWDVCKVPENLNIPMDALNAFESFQLFYLSKHMKKKMRLHCSYGTAELKATFFNSEQQPVRTRLLTVPTLCMIVLLLFNDRLALTFDEIQVSTNISEGSLKTLLQRLVFGRMKILRKFPEGEEILPDSLFTVNEDFKPRHHRARIQFLDLHKETEEEKKVIHEDIEKHRGYELSAAIVRVMKARQSMKHNSLVAEVIDMVKSRFTPDPAKIKKEIETLIDRDYIGRESGQMDSYRYIS